MLRDRPHRRRNLLTGEWVLVSPHRTLRPWNGERAERTAPHRPSHDPDCHLCPGNARVGGERNPDYTGTYVFPNDFPALLAQSSLPGSADGLFEAEPAHGEARVICYGPDHSLSLASMDDEARRRLVDCWCDLSQELGAQWDHVQIFENRGSMMGASSPHPHGQVWASSFVPELVAREEHRQAEFSERECGKNLLEAVIAAELADGERIVAQNDHWLVIVPHWAAWPFETLLIARDKVTRLEQLTGEARKALAHILGRLLAGYDKLFECEFPYSMGWHGAPHGLRDAAAHWRLHAHFYPPLLRSATVRKHMVGFELLAETQRDLTPELAAQRLREVLA